MVKRIILSILLLIIFLLNPSINYGQQQPGISIPTYNTADYNKVIIITTSNDIIDAYDGLISFREACLKAKTYMPQYSVLILFKASDGLCKIEEHFLPDESPDPLYSEQDFRFTSGRIAFDMHKLATVVQGIKFNGDINSIGYNSGLIFIDNIDKAVIKNLKFENFVDGPNNRYPIYILTNNNSIITIEHCEFVNNDCIFLQSNEINFLNNINDQVDSYNDSDYGLLIHTTQQTSVKNNIFNNSNTKISNLYNSDNYFVSIKNNIIKNSPSIGLWMTFPKKNWVMENNTFQNNYDFDIYTDRFNSPNQGSNNDGFKIIEQNNLGYIPFNTGNIFLSTRRYSIGGYSSNWQIIGEELSAPVWNMTQYFLPENHTAIVRETKITIESTFWFQWGKPIDNRTTNSIYSTNGIPEIYNQLYDVEAIKVGNYIVLNYRFQNSNFYSFGNFVVDFYTIDGYNSIVHYLGHSINYNYADVTSGASFSTMIPIPSGITLNEGDNVGVAVTSLGDNTNTPLGTARVLGVEIMPPLVITNLNCAGKPSQLAVSGISNIDSYLWTFPYNTTSTSPTPSFTFAESGNHTISVEITLSSGMSVSLTQTIFIFDCNCCDNTYTITLPETPASLTDDAKFYRNILTGDIIFKRDGCPILYPFECFGDKPSETLLENVVSATATTYSDELVKNDIYFQNMWIYGFTGFPNNANIFERGEANKWNVQRQYVYREELDATTSGNNAQIRNYNKGTFTLSGFNWDKLSANNPDKWIWTKQFNNYSPNGNALEDENMLGIHSSAQYGYNYTLLTAVTQNAEQFTSYFFNFENTHMSDGVIVDENTQAHWENTGTIASDIAHTGHNSISLKHNMSSDEAFWLGRIKCNERIMSEGYLIRIWVHVNKSATDLQDGDLQIYTDIIDMDNWTGYNVPVIMRKVAGAGEWMLYEAVYAAEQLNAINQGNNPVYIDFGLNLNTNSYADGEIHIDDVKIQPFLSEMTCYVYDNMQRITAAFDDQHFATLYQYNAEGDLIRKLKETVEGIKTISETQYNSRKTDR